MIQSKLTQLTVFEDNGNIFMFYSETCGRYFFDKDDSLRFSNKKWNYNCWTKMIFENVSAASRENPDDIVFSVCAS